jgi:hypothetical protein
VVGSTTFLLGENKGFLKKNRGENKVGTKTPPGKQQIKLN